MYVLRKLRLSKPQLIGPGLLLANESMKSINGDKEPGWYKRNLLPFLHKYVPITRWMPKYTLAFLLSDFIAGTTVGLMVIPQALAYASLAGLQNQYGLYSSFMGCFVYCFLGTSKDLTIGPTAILSLMVNIYGNPKEPQYTVTFTFYVGAVLLLMGIFRLGFLVKFISTPVISAFTSAAAIVIAMSQVKDILGLHNIPRDFFPSIVSMAEKIKKVNPWDILFGVTCMMILFLLRLLAKWKWITEAPPDNIHICKNIIRKILWFFGTARNAFIVFISIIIGYILSDKGYQDALTLSDDIDFGLPPWEVGISTCMKLFCAELEFCRLTSLSNSEGLSLTISSNVQKGSINFLHCNFYRVLVLIATLQTKEKGALHD